MPTLGQAVLTDTTQYQRWACGLHVLAPLSSTADISVKGCQYITKGNIVHDGSDAKRSVLYESQDQGTTSTYPNKNLRLDGGRNGISSAPCTK